MIRVIRAFGIILVTAFALEAGHAWYAATAFDYKRLPFDVSNLHLHDTYYIIMNPWLARLSGALGVLGLFMAIMPRQIVGLFVKKKGDHGSAT